MLIKDTELKTWGNSKALRIGKDELAALGLSDKQLAITLIVENGKILRCPKTKYPQTLDELFAGYDGAALTPDDRYEWDEPVGREII
jgi:antitoxin MazE